VGLDCDDERDTRVCNCSSKTSLPEDDSSDPQWSSGLLEESMRESIDQVVVEVHVQGDEM